jgi:hypothetical protein
MSKSYADHGRAVVNVEAPACGSESRGLDREPSQIDELDLLRVEVGHDQHLPIARDLE